MAAQDYNAESLRAQWSGKARSCAEIAVPSPKETAAAYFCRDLMETLRQMEVVSNRLSSAKKRLQEHFGVPVQDSARLQDAGGSTAPYAPSMDGTRALLNDLSLRLESIASGLEELV